MPQRAVEEAKEQICWVLPHRLAEHECLDAHPQVHNS